MSAKGSSDRQEGVPRSRLQTNRFHVLRVGASALELGPPWSGFPGRNLPTSPEIRPSLGSSWWLTGLSVSCLLVLADGDLTDTISGPRSTASDLTSSKASTKSPTQRHNPFNEEQAESASSETTPVHTTSQEKEEAQAPDQPDACTELEVIRSAGSRPGRRWASTCAQCPPLGLLCSPGQTEASPRAGGISETVCDIYKLLLVLNQLSTTTGQLSLIDFSLLAC